MYIFTAKASEHKSFQKRLNMRKNALCTYEDKNRPLKVVSG